MKMEVVVLGWAIVAGQVALRQGQEGEEGVVEGITGATAGATSASRAMVVVGVVVVVGGLGMTGTGVGQVALLGHCMHSEKSQGVYCRMHLHLGLQGSLPSPCLHFHPCNIYSVYANGPCLCCSNQLSC